MVPRGFEGAQPGSAGGGERDLLVVGRVGRAHGVHGQVAVVPRTDDPDGRFVTGARLITDPLVRGPLTVDGHVWHSGRLLVMFAGCATRNQAEALHGTVLMVDASTDPPLDDPDEFYDGQLVGLRVETEAGLVLGTVTEVVHTGGQDLLAVARGDGRELLVPFVTQIVPTVDLAGGRLVVEPPDGLLEL